MKKNVEIDGKNFFNQSIISLIIGNIIFNFLFTIESSSKCSFFVICTLSQSCQMVLTYLMKFYKSNILTRAKSIVFSLTLPL